MRRRRCGKQPSLLPSGSLSHSFLLVSESEEKEKAFFPTPTPRRNASTKRCLHFYDPAPLHDVIVLPTAVVFFFGYVSDGQILVVKGAGCVVVFKMEEKTCCSN